MSDLLNDEVVRAVLGERLTASVESVFASIAVAEDEIAKIRGTDVTDRNDPVWRAFKLLQPPEGLRFPSQRVYRIHCHEILLRVRNGEDTTVASTTGPLESGVTALLTRLVAKHYPNEFPASAVTPSSGDERDADDWDQKLRLRYAQTWRKEDE